MWEYLTRTVAKWQGKVRLTVSGEALIQGRQKALESKMRTRDTVSSGPCINTGLESRPFHFILQSYTQP